MSSTKIRSTAHITEEDDDDYDDGDDTWYYPFDEKPEQFKAFCFPIEHVPPIPTLI